MSMEGERTVPCSIAALAFPELVLGGVKGSRASIHRRAVVVVAVALWSLRETGAIGLSSWRRRRWLPFSALAVGLRTGQLEDASLEKDLVNQTRVILAGAGHGPDLRVTVADVILGWMADVETISSNSDPYRDVLQIVTEQAKAAGWCEDVTQVPGGTLLTRLVTPRAVTVLSPARAAAVERAAQTLAADWQRFLRDEAALARWLIASVMLAILFRKTENDYD